MPSARPLTTGTPDAPSPRPIAYATSVPRGSPVGCPPPQRPAPREDGERLGAAGANSTAGGSSSSSSGGCGSRGRRHRELARGEALALAVGVECSRNASASSTPPGRGGEQLVLGQRQQAGRPSVAPAEQPGDARREVGDQEARRRQAAVDHAATRSQPSSR